MQKQSGATIGKNDVEWISESTLAKGIHIHIKRKNVLKVNIILTTIF